MMKKFLFLLLIYITNCSENNDKLELLKKINYYTNEEAARKLPSTVQILTRYNGSLEIFTRGAIISEDFVLSLPLAMFIENKVEDDVRVISGASSLHAPYDSEEKSEFAVHKVSKFIFHVNYSCPAENGSDYDKAKPYNIVLLKLENPLEISDLQKPVQIRSTPLDKEELVEVFGFEKLTNGSLENLQSHQTQILNKEDCQKEYQKNNIDMRLAKDEFCIWTNLFGVRLILDLHGELIGLTSRVLGKNPVICTNVSMHRDWILSHVHAEKSYKNFLM